MLRETSLKWNAPRICAFLCSPSKKVEKFWVRKEVCGGKEFCARLFWEIRRFFGGLGLAKLNSFESYLIGAGRLC